MQHDKIKKIQLVEKKDALSRAREKYELFIAGAYIDIAKPYNHPDNNADKGKEIRYKIWDYYNSLGHNIYMGEDSELRTLGQKHYGPLSNAVFYERHYIKENIDTLIVFPYGPGVFCELGDWATAKNICEKMLVVIDSPFEGQTNYINDGVVKAAKTFHATIHYVDYHDFDAVKKVCDDFVELRASFARLDVLYAR